MKTATVRDLRNQFPRVAAWIALTVLVSLLPSLGLAQLTRNQRMGAYAPGGSYVPETAQAKQQRQQYEQRALDTALGGHDYRKIGGRIQYMRDASLFMQVQIVSTLHDGVLICCLGFPDPDDRRRAVKNYRGEAITGRYPRILAKRTGTYRYGTETLELYDCGTLLTPAEEREIAANARTAQETAQAAAQDRAADARAAAAERARVNAERALKSDQDDAAKGDADGLARMGVRYRDGYGVEKDLAKAEEYLTKAANAGSLHAARVLADMKQAATPPPAKP
jgi:hypothetical protein